LHTKTAYSELLQIGGNKKDEDSANSLDSIYLSNDLKNMTKTNRIEEHLAI
jgi:hypothetical protein